jgi:hypothetical protein
MTTNPSSNRLNSDLEMQAMLYALGDPSLDREAFEFLMDSSSEAMEAVSRAVWMIQGVKSSQSTPIAPLVVATTSVNVHRPTWNQVVWIASALAMAASLVAFFSLREPLSDSDSGSEWSAIASAWSDVQTSDLKGFDPLAPRELATSTLDSEDFTLASTTYPDDELPDSDDIPNWLITAASRANSTAEGTLQ